MTDALTEDERLDVLYAPISDLLLHMLLEFEQAFAAKALDELGVSEEDAESVACFWERHDKGGGGAGTVLAYLLRHVNLYRALRSVEAEHAAIVAAGGPDMMRVDDIAGEFAKLNKGDAMTDRAEPPWAELDDGIRETVRLLWENGFDPTDSGDGSKVDTMDCTWGMPHVFMVVIDPCNLVSSAKRLYELALRCGIAPPIVGPMIQANYSPDDGVSTLQLWGRLP